MTQLVYIAAPLANEAERSFNVRLRDFVRDSGFSTYLPQEDAGVLSELLRLHLGDEDTLRQHLFRSDEDAVRRCEILIAVLDGRVIDEGVCIELGIAYSLGKRCLGFKTDSRTSLRNHDNIMVEGVLECIVRTWEELQRALASLRRG